MAPDRDAALAEIARKHLGFGTLARQGDDRDYRDLSMRQVESALAAAFAAGREAARVGPPERAPDCTTERAAAIAGTFAAAVMAGDISLSGKIGYDFVQRLPFIGDERGGQDYDEGLRTAILVIEARARASVRAPSHAALSGAAAALAVIEYAIEEARSLLDANLSVDAEDLVGDMAAAAALLRDGLAPLSAAPDEQAPEMASPAA